jgi:orotate phosphoribosyltransferase
MTIPRRCAAVRRLHQISASSERTLDLAHSLYDAGLFTRNQREHVRQNGTANRWALDLRRAIAAPGVLARVSGELVRLLRHGGVRQIAGRGFGAFLVVGGILAAAAEMAGGLLREKRKSYGFREILEGNLSRSRRVVLIDDVVQAGESLRSAATVLRAEGFRCTEAVTVFAIGEVCNREALFRGRIRVQSLAVLLPSSCVGARSSSASGPRSARRSTSEKR